MVNELLSINSLIKFGIIFLISVIFVIDMLNRFDYFESQEELHKKTPKMRQSTTFGRLLLFLFIISLIILYLIFVYLLNTPIEDWLFNLGQYNSQLLELFPKAQHWVNASVAYRENIIPVYVLYKIFFYSFIIISFALLIKRCNWITRHSILIYNNPSILSNPFLTLLSLKYARYPMVILLLCFMLFMLLFMHSFIDGSQTYIYQENNEFLNSVNSLIILIFFLCLSTYILMSWPIYIFIVTIIFFKKIKKNNRRRVKT